MSTNELKAIDASRDALMVRDLGGEYRAVSADEVLQQAWRVLAARVRCGQEMSSPQVVKDYLRLQIGLLEHEMFALVLLDAQHRILGSRP